MTDSYLQSPTRWSTRDTLHVLTLSTSILTFLIVQLNVPDPYLDEIFHIPQTQRYCDEDFDTWDPAITTPPGLYLLSAIPLMTVHIPCSPPILRSTNLLFTLLIPGIISSILRPSLKAFWKHLLLPTAPALVVGAFPLIFLFGNLYYTDVASLAGVLGAYALAMRKRHWAASLVGAWAMTVRQTNVVWLAFVVGVSVLAEIREDEERKRVKEDEGEVGRSDPLLRDVAGFPELFSGARSTVLAITARPEMVIRVGTPYLPTFLGFLTFLWWNGGIVLGHKDLHEPVLHLPQILYCIAFASIMLAPNLLAEGLDPTVRGVMRVGLGSKRRIAETLVALGVLNIAVHYFTIYHPFLLADNRHYVFYLLRWVFLPYPSAKYLVTPLYLLGIWTWNWGLRNTATLAWMIGLIACSALFLVPSPLIEPRYFLIPTILLRLQLDTPSDDALWLEYGWYTLINFSTVSLFLLRTFRWEGSEGWMRFMW